MSLLNAWVTPAEAIVAVDTDGATQAGERMPASKLLPIPHLNAVIALRGQAAFLALTFLRCVAGSFATFDELDAAMLEVLQDVEASLLPEMIAPGRIGNELITVGWSACQGRMLGRRFVKRDDMTAFEAAETNRHVSPWHASLQGTPTTSHKLEQLARAQVRWMRATFANAACGGNLIVCRLTRKTLSLETRSPFKEQQWASTATSCTA